ncbi:SAM-dependent methyltransferase [Desulfolithobacter dissulfuricans]|uniref:SAM-dependent methyltransferase n=2 Tax=Desulfolithobacter dissulfuricans TaxID=2795293 RepID=A0A915XKY5_9BACT|nr:SAM-dependent methyltransferase [Desulfolithobacter dissulfuricans]
MLGHQQNTPDFYHTHARKYFEQTRAIDSSRFLGVLAHRLPKGATVLDIGCGSGRDLLYLKNSGFCATGLERSAKLAELARKFSGCPVIEGDFTCYDFSSLRCDALVLVGALVHLQKPELGPVLGRISQALEQDGLIYLSLKHGNGQYRNDDGRIFTLWQHEELEKIFTGCGFVNLDFSRNRSAMNPHDTWLGYLLQKQDTM